jgi:hypothetical protein
MQAVRQVVFTDVLIVGRLDVDCQSFAPIGVHKIDLSSDWFLIKRHSNGMEGSDWLLIKRHSNGMEGLPGVQIQN